MNTIKCLILLLLIAAILSCNLPNEREGELKQVPTINQQLDLARVELSKFNTDFVIEDQDTVNKIQSFFESASRIDVSLEQFSSEDTCKIGLIHSDGHQNRYYMIDLKNGLATIGAKTVMPVYKIEKPDELSTTLRNAGWLIETAK